MLTDLKGLALCALAFFDGFFRSLFGVGQPVPSEPPKPEPQLFAPAIAKAERVWITEIDKRVLQAQDFYLFNFKDGRPKDGNETFEDALDRVIKAGIGMWFDYQAKNGKAPDIVHTCVHHWVSGRMVSCGVFIRFSEDNGRIIPTVSFRKGDDVRTAARAINAILN